MPPRSHPPEDDGPSLREFIIYWILVFVLIMVALWAIIHFTTPAYRQV